MRLLSSLGSLKSLIPVVIGVVFAVWLFRTSVFYAEPGYIYHVRTLTGNEKVVSDVGYQFFPVGRWNAWKKAMTVQAVRGEGESFSAEADYDSTSASGPPVNIMFLDQVDADAEATVRFSIPTDSESFLKLAREYRSPENLLRTALIPAFKETLQANASLMSAEEYYSGGRTEFNNSFENQMADGIYIVRREEVRTQALKSTTGSANASLGENQVNYGDNSKVTFEVRKTLDENGQPLRKRQKFVDFNITVVDARITNMAPNSRFVERMQLKQKASADRAIAREQRVQEEEQRLLAIARGEREVAERQAQAKVEQIQRTTEAETEKQLALTKAQKLREQAEIERETAKINLEKAQIEAEMRKELADAAAYEKRVILEADNALAQKLDAEIAIQQAWAEAYSRRAVPSTVLSSGEGSQATVGADQEIKTFMQLLAVEAAERLHYNRSLNNE